MIEFYKYIDKYNLKEAQMPLIKLIEEDGQTLKQYIFNPIEEDYKELGYYRKKYTSPPEDNEYYYNFYWDEGSIGRPFHLQMWEKGEKIEPIQNEMTVVQKAFSTLKENTENATTIKGLREGINTAVEIINRELGE